MNALQQTKQKFSVAIQGEGYKKLISSTLSDPKRAQRFIASVSSAVAANPGLQECDAGSILSSALLGEALNLSPSPQLGHYYLVPYKKKARIDNRGNVIEPEKVTAQFQIGYKGYCQLAMRSGFYKRINVVEIRQGELIRFDLLNEEIQVAMEEDDEIREGLDVIGYYAMFEYLNGFRKEIYWTKKKMLNHADKYSQAFDKTAYDAISSSRIQNLPKGKKPADGYVSSADMWKYSSFWYKSFDEMAFKTMLRHLLSRWGIMSIEMTEAFSKDMSEIKDNGDIDFIDSTTTTENYSAFDEVTKAMDAAETIQDLKSINTDDLTEEEKKQARKVYSAAKKRIESVIEEPQESAEKTYPEKLKGASIKSEDEFNDVLSEMSGDQLAEHEDLIVELQAGFHDPFAG